MYLLRTHEMLFDVHHYDFTAWGGIPRRGIYDNIKTAVDRVRPGRVREDLAVLQRKPEPRSPSAKSARWPTR